MLGFLYQAHKAPGSWLPAPGSWLPAANSDLRLTSNAVIRYPFTVYRLSHLTTNKVPTHGYTVHGHTVHSSQSAAK